MFSFHQRTWILIFLATWVGLASALFDEFEEISTSTTEDSMGGSLGCGKGSNAGKEKCVYYNKCDPKTGTITENVFYSPGVQFTLDISYGPGFCPETMDVCCKVPPEEPETTSPETPSTTTTTTTTTPPPPPPVQLSCGLRNENGIEFKLKGNTHNEAEYGEFPWMAAILDKNKPGSKTDPFSICGGSLIAPSVVLTAAHCVENYTRNPGVLKVRMGEWDSQTTKESLPHQDRDVKKVILHSGYVPRVLINDVALLILANPYRKELNVATICLPEQSEQISSDKCFVTGWGKNVFGAGGRYQQILKKVQVATVNHTECQALLRDARFGERFNLDNTFMCAGDEGKDACTGDGGGPLVCPDPKQPHRYLQVGVVAWGVECGSKAPGVYVDVAKFRTWVDGHMDRLKFNKNNYIK